MGNVKSLFMNPLKSKNAFNKAAIQAKGYKEYTFAIRQSGTDAPVLYLIKNDFGVTPLTASYTTIGQYGMDLSTLGYTYADRLDWSLVISNAKLYGKGYLSARMPAPEPNLRIFTPNESNILENGILTDEYCTTISIRKTID